MTNPNEESEFFAHIEEDGKIHMRNLVAIGNGFESSEEVVLDAPPSFVQSNASSNPSDLNSFEEITKAAQDSAARFKELFSE